MFTLNNLKKCIYNSKRLVKVYTYLHYIFIYFGKYLQNTS